MADKLSVMIGYDAIEVILVHDNALKRLNQMIIEIIEEIRFNLGSLFLCPEMHSTKPNFFSSLASSFQPITQSKTI